MPGLDPGICEKVAPSGQVHPDGRVKPGHDEHRSKLRPVGIRHRQCGTACEGDRLKVFCRNRRTGEQAAAGTVAAYACQGFMGGRRGAQPAVCRDDGGGFRFAAPALHAYWAAAWGPAAPPWRKRSTLALAAALGHSSRSQRGSGSLAPESGNRRLRRRGHSGTGERVRHLVIDFQAVAVGVGEIKAALADVVDAAGISTPCWPAGGRRRPVTPRSWRP